MDRGILMDFQRAVTPVGRHDELQAVAALGFRKVLLGIRGRQALHLWHDPDLKEMHRVPFRGIEFGMADAGAGRHKLHIARPDHDPLPKELRWAKAPSRT